MQSLYRICLQKTVFLLRTGIWNTISPNPFSNLPSKIVDDLMLILTTRRIYLREVNSRYVKLSDIYLLVTSGRLTHLQLNSFKFDQEYDLFLKILRTNCCKNLRMLSLFFVPYVGNISFAETLISLFPKLEEFYANFILPNFEVFKNCTLLRILRFRKKLDSLNFSVDFSVFSLLKNLEIVSFIDMDNNLVFKILQYCPKLLSLGSNDSLNALTKIQESSLKDDSAFPMNIYGQLQLRKCLWGSNLGCILDKQDKEIFTFSQKLKTAVSLCPNVADLIVCIYEGKSVNELKYLKKLTKLKIDFLNCVDDYMPNFIELLREIGHHLIYLFVLCPLPVSVDIICECCPYLQILEIHGDAMVSKSAPTNQSLLLNKLRLTNADRKSLLFLLCNSKCLEELVMRNVLCLDDCLLDQVFKLNPLADLKEIDILQCSLSKEGFQLLLQNSPSLKKVLTSNHSYRTVQSLIDKLNLTHLINEYFYDLAYHTRLQCGQIGISHFGFH